MSEYVTEENASRLAVREAGVGGLLGGMVRTVPRACANSRGSGRAVSQECTCRQAECR
jgi:hypothetical protein